MNKRLKLPYFVMETLDKANVDLAKSLTRDDKSSGLIHTSIKTGAELCWKAISEAAEKNVNLIQVKKIFLDIYGETPNFEDDLNKFEMGARYFSTLCEARMENLEQEIEDRKFNEKQRILNN